MVTQINKIEITNLRNTVINSILEGRAMAPRQTTLPVRRYIFTGQMQEPMQHMLRPPFEEYSSKWKCVEPRPTAHSRCEVESCRPAQGWLDDRPRPTPTTLLPVWPGYRWMFRLMRGQGPFQSLHPI
ncbi:uncharacterized protein LY89DRAFT_303124 [Mollisia scopiformis]|uniref:Uncharacterized protein n=1 Tax=Mollisia scopiformis TaxID=149040 RepID=A0A194XQJ7_MOLSC|nr:uncharacterized protein LY89DRAFT_303124 [Mollisia scopiformis]KUJ22545.1 hypothetical protein LY89DRAFT_303124 [Mollisia scopiformis]